MIEVDIETLVPLKSVPALAEESGRRLNLATLYRWRIKGCAGVRLEVCYVLGKPYTSVEALARFDQRVTEAKTAQPTISLAKATRKQAAKSHEAAKRRLAGAK